ncbi:MAG: hypothetical protein ACFFBS_01950, partial [Promethearchaeota archaeon]
SAEIRNLSTKRLRRITGWRAIYTIKTILISLPPFWNLRVKPVFVHVCPSSVRHASISVLNKRKGL